MAVIKEFRCAAHGCFEGSHPICPELGCDSTQVERVFLTPTSVSTGKFKRFDAGIRDQAERMGISNWKTARQGESSFAGRAQENKDNIGKDLLWGKDIERVMGRSMATQIQQAGTPLVVDGKDPAKDPYLTINNGMRSAATTIGITQNRLPKAEVTRPMHDDRLAT